MSKPDDSGAMLQFECRRSLGRNREYSHIGTMVHEIIMELSVKDCFRNGGTVVLVVSDDTITIVQRPKGSDKL